MIRIINDIRNGDIFSDWHLTSIILDKDEERKPKDYIIYLVDSQIKQAKWPTKGIKYADHNQ